MKKLLSVLTVGAAIAAAFTPASAQVNTVPQVGVYQGYVSISSGVLGVTIQWTEE